MKLLIVIHFLIVTVGLNSAEQSSEALKPGKSVPLQQLIEMLQGEDGSIRSGAAYYIGEQGAAAVDAVPELIERIEQDKTQFVIHSAVKALGKVGAGHERTIPVLFKTFSQHPSGARWYAAEGLVHIGDAAIPTLLAGTSSEIVTEEMWSQITMAQIRGVESVHFQFVLDTFSSEDRTRSAIAMRGLAMMQSSLPAEALPRLLKALEVSGADRTEILAIIGGMRARAAPAIPEIIPLLDDPSYMVSLRAIQAIGSIGGPQAAPAVPALIRLLDSERDFLRRCIAETLGAIGAEAADAIPKLIETMHHDSNNNARLFAALSLLKIAANSNEVQQAFITAMKTPLTNIGGVATHFAQNVPATRGWIDTFLELYEQGHVSQSVLRHLYYRVSPEEQKRFPVQFDRFVDG